jgi:hypothetical protein
MRHRIFVLMLMVAIDAVSAVLVASWERTSSASRRRNHDYITALQWACASRDGEARSAGQEDSQDHPTGGACDYQRHAGVPIFFNLAFVPTDNISGMDAEILISLKEPHRPVAEYMREIRSKIPPKFPADFISAADIVTQVLNFGLPARSTSKSRISI